MDTLRVPAGYRIERGLMWPADDRECAAVVFDTVPDMGHALKHCRGFDLAVQAGGNMGVWALSLAERFKKVVTFEPDPMNFRALVYNTSTAANILAMPCALGTDVGWCDMDREAGNAGAHQVKDGAVSPVIRLDSLDLPACDLIYLDIEGFEMPALIGSIYTITKFRPVIAIEDKGLSRRYGYAQGEAEKYLGRHGYRVVARPHRDVVFAWQP